MITRRHTPEYLLENFIKVKSGCWIWNRSISGGYGMSYSIFKPWRQQQAHIASWEYHNKRKVPKGMKVLHKCDVKPCINPKHLFIGTSADNSADMVAKKRQAYGARNAKAKLTDRKVLRIRRLYKRGNITQKALGEMFGVKRATIKDITTERRWRHLL